MTRGARCQSALSSSASFFFGSASALFGVYAYPVLSSKPARSGLREAVLPPLAGALAACVSAAAAPGVSALFAAIFALRTERRTGVSTSRLHASCARVLELARHALSTRIEPAAPPASLAPSAALFWPVASAWAIRCGGAWKALPGVAGRIGLPLPIGVPIVGRSARAGREARRGVRDGEICFCA